MKKYINMFKGLNKKVQIGIAAAVVILVLIIIL
jgi:hypothetical protein